jgi:ATP-dependent RNA helicase DDX54/DBP10
MLENAIMDITPDDAVEMNKKKRMMRWDAKKRKFVKVRL